MNAIVKINREAKAIQRRHPKKSWKAAHKEATRKYNSGEIGKGKRKKSHKPTRKKKRVAGVSTRSKSHIDRNKFRNVDIQIGSIAHHLSAAKKGLEKRLGELEARKYMAPLKRTKNKIQSTITKVKKQLNRLK